MAESLPLDPFWGVANYLRGHDNCSDEVRDCLISSTAAALGIAVCILPNKTEEDHRVIDVLMGLDSINQQASTILSPPDTQMRLHIADAERRPTVFFARLPNGEENPEVLGNRLNDLHVAVKDLTSRLN